MEAPLGFNFFKKIQIYQQIRSLDKRSTVQLNEFPDAGGTSPTWPIEKKILHWSYRGHVHLLTPLKQKWLYEPDGDLNNKGLNKLADMNINYDRDLPGAFHGLSKEERNKKVELVVKKTFENLIHRGFASWRMERAGNNAKNIEDGIYITSEGLLAGEVLNELDNPFIKRLLYPVWGKLLGHAGAILLLLVFIPSLIDSLKKIIIWILCWH